MIRAEHLPGSGMEALDFGSLEAGFDINAAFQEALSGVVTDEELALEEKVRRMETIITESNSEVYRSFVDFRSMAAQMQGFCSHDHAFNQAVQGSDALSGFMDGHRESGGHNHAKDDEIDPKTGKKRKRRSGWFGLSM